MFLLYFIVLRRRALCRNDHRTQHQSLKQVFYEKFLVWKSCHFGRHFKKRSKQTDRCKARTSRYRALHESAFLMQLTSAETTEPFYQNNFCACCAFCRYTNDIYQQHRGMMRPQRNHHKATDRLRRLLIPRLSNLTKYLGRRNAKQILITKTRLFKYTENFTIKKWTFSDKNSVNFHISAQNIDCGYSLEPPRRSGSKEYPQSMFLSRNN